MSSAPDAPASRTETAHTLNIDNHDSSPSSGSPNGAAGPTEPPGMASKKDVGVDEVWKEMQKHPLFMTHLDPAESSEETNDILEALKALAYEGTRAEVALNFKDQGNECVAEKRWIDAREFYTKGIMTARGLVEVHEEPEDPDVKIIEEPDPEEEARKERKVEEQCLVNRALCQLEMKNYGSCNRDCAATLKINPRNLKAWFRAASACLALDKVEEALDACDGGLQYDPNNTALRNLRSSVEKRRDYVAGVDRDRKAREERKARGVATMKHALKSRNILSRETPHPPNMEDAAISLADPLDASSVLSFPLVILYPLEAQSDFIKSCQEGESVGEHLAYILPTPWDEKGEYTPNSVECYVETREGGLIKAGKKMSLLRLLSSGKVELVDGLVRVNVVPREKATTYIEEFKKRRGEP